MSVYIKDMEMPKACVYRENGYLITCPLYDLDGYCGALNTEASHKENGKLSDCPLIEVPTPHGDLINPNWIPVTEQLPENVRKSYLCLTDTGYHCEVRWTNNVYGLWKSDDEWGWNIVDVPQYCKVTHWMPLPSAPKEE